MTFPKKVPQNTAALFDIVFTLFGTVADMTHRIWWDLRKWNEECC